MCTVTHKKERVATQTNMTRMGTDKQLDSPRRIRHYLHYAHTRKQGNIGLGFVLVKTFECSFVKNSVRGNPDWQFGIKSYRIALPLMCLL